MQNRCVAAYDDSRWLWAWGRSPARLKSSSVKPRTEPFRHLVTALSHSYCECLRRSLGHFFFPTTARFSPPCASRSGGHWRFWQFSDFSPGGGSFWFFAFPPPPAACSARPADVALSISHLHSVAPKKHNGGTGNAGLRFDCALITCNRKALNRLRKENRPRAASLQCFTSQGAGTQHPMHFSCAPARSHTITANSKASATRQAQ